MPIDIGDALIGPMALGHIGEGQFHRLMAVLVDDDCVVRSVVESKGRSAIGGDPGRALELRFPDTLVEVVEVGPVARVVLAQGGGEGYGEAEFAIVLQGDLDGDDRAGNGVDDADRDGVGGHGHVQVHITQIRVFGDVLAVDRPGDAPTGRLIDLQGHILAGQLLKDFLVQLGPAGGEVNPCLFVFSGFYGSFLGSRPPAGTGTQKRIETKIKVQADQRILLAAFALALCCPHNGIVYRHDLIK